MVHFSVLQCKAALRGTLYSRTTAPPAPQSRHVRDGENDSPTRSELLVQLRAHSSAPSATMNAKCESSALRCDLKSFTVGSASNPVTLARYTRM